MIVFHGIIALISPGLGRNARHLTHDASSYARTIFALCRASEAKVDQFNVPVLVEHYFLKIEVEVRHTIRVHIVDGLKHLFQIESADVFRKTTCVSNVV